jgi:hypothetical protein
MVKKMKTGKKDRLFWQEIDEETECVRQTNDDDVHNEMQ